MAQQDIADSGCLLESLYCDEESWGEDERETEGEEDSDGYKSRSSLPPPLLTEQDLFWEDDDLLSLFSKEQETGLDLHRTFFSEDSVLSAARMEAVDWMLKVNAHYSFSTLTAVLSVSYLDRFLASVHFQRDKPWMAQLAAVACLSLAAKVDETHVPLLLDLQVEETAHIFEAKTIQRMELLVLSTLEWKMNPVTPLSFIEHITRRLGLKTHLHWNFFRRCERLLLCFIADERFVNFPPSVAAAAIMLQVINELEPWNPLEYQRQLMNVMKINKDRVSRCHEFISELSSSDRRKRRYLGDGFLQNSSDTSTDSWVSSASSSQGHLLKKSRSDSEPFRMAPPASVCIDAIIATP